MQTDFLESEYELKHFITLNIYYVGSDKFNEKYLLHQRVSEQITTSLSLANYTYIFPPICLSHKVIFFLLTKEKFEMGILSEIFCCNLAIEFDW